MEYFKLGVILLIGICVAVAIYDDSAGPVSANISQQASAESGDSLPPRNPDIDAAAAEMADRGAAPPVTTGAGDPYAAGQQARGVAEYARSKADLLDQMRVAEFAARCRVIAPTDVTVMLLSGLRAISDDNTRAGLSDYHPDLLPAAKAAAAEGDARADGPGACDYWLQHPDVVAGVRQAAELAQIQ